MNKRVLILSLVLSLSILISGVYAVEDLNENQKVAKAEQCINSILQNKTSSTIGFDDAVFSMLALGSKSNLVEAINNQKSSSESCWPKAGCKLKDTAWASLALKDVNTKKWIIGKNISVNGLSWYLQIDIDTQESSQCTISYDTQNINLNIDEDAKVSGSTGACLDLSPNGFWLSIKRTCQEKTFSISCDKTFVTSVLYQKGNDGPVYVSNDAQTSGAGTSVEEKIEGKCLGTGTTCDYEGTLWGALALKKSGEDITRYLPYLGAFAEDNKKYFPSAFLNILAGGDNYFSEVIQAQSQSKYWQMAGTPYNKFFDTALGMLSLGGTGATELANAKTYMLSIQQDSGCWNNNNLRDSAFILYSGWKSSGTGVVSGGTTPEVVTCANAGYDCGTAAQCTDAGGETMYNYDCSSEGFGSVCCNKNIQEENCAQKGGIVCSNEQTCSSSVVGSSDGSCCTTACVDAPTETQCELGGGICASSCNSNEKSIEESCGTTNQFCCVAKTGSSLWLWIIILLLLIAGVALGIIYRQKIILWWHSRKFRASGTPVMRNYPSTPSSPSRPAGGFFQNPFSSQTRAPQRTQKRDSEFEETLRKLKEMSK